MQKPTRQQIDAEIAKLKAERDTLPEFSFFGDPNWVIIDAQIDILEGKITDESELLLTDDLGENGYNTAILAFDFLNGTTDSLTD